MDASHARPTETSPEMLNEKCFCTTLDRKALFQAMQQESEHADFCETIAKTRPHLFSNVSVFLSAKEFALMRGVVTAIEQAVKISEYRHTALSWAPEIAQFDPGPAGAVMGYDFHFGSDGPKLIEINTNAGGAFLCALLTRASVACCRDERHEHSAARARHFDTAIVQMFLAEWSHQRGHGQPRRIAIVDDSPSDQYLYPEMVLAQRLFQKYGIEAVIADAKDLIYANGQLLAGGQAIDLVYNRLVDFSLELPEHTALRSAYLADKVVLTPNPRIHALFADKRNLTLLSDPAKLKQWGLDENAISTLTVGIPHTSFVTPETAVQLWKERRRLFFKPAAGYGSKGAYRGDKLTKSVWKDVTTGDYVVQSFAPPGQRAIKVNGAATSLKADIRLYTYAGDVLLVAARLYQGQTTNFRTPGGGFAPVFEV